MRELVRQAMEEGAVGLGSSLIYAPAYYAPTEELIELAKVVAQYDGLYISHIRSEGSRLLEAVDELEHVAREAGVRAEVYHFEAAGKSNWDKLDAAVDKIDAARREGLTSRLTCTPMLVARPGSTRLCHDGYRKEAMRNGSND
jgi:N-acyl-D-amino-acid deacylase